MRNLQRQGPVPQPEARRYDLAVAAWRPHSEQHPLLVAEAYGPDDVRAVVFGDSRRTQAGPDRIPAPPAAAARYRTPSTPFPRGGHRRRGRAPRPALPAERPLQKETS